MPLDVVTLALAGLAGLLTLLNPCVLPLLPAVAAGAAGRHWLGLPALGLGLAAAFTTAGVFLAGGGRLLGFSGEQWRLGSAIAMLAFGMVLLSGRLRGWFARASSALGDAGHRLAERVQGGHPAAQLALGGLLGLAWTPCVGPTLGAAVSLAATGDDPVTAAVVMAVYSVAAVLPLLAAGSGLRAWRRPERLSRTGGYGRVLLGITLLLIGGLVITGLDKTVEAWLLDILPSGLIRLSTTP